MDRYALGFFVILACLAAVFGLQLEVCKKVKDLEGLLSGMDSEFEYLYDSHGYKEMWDEYWSKYK